jgi:solute carrier family 45 protein 1/2/4
MLALASAKPTVHTLAALIGADPASATAQGTVLTSAILCLFGLYIFIQPMQAGIRSLIIDTCPTHQQSIASAWASRLTGVGNIIGYSFGFVPVGTILPGVHIHQFAWLCLVASILLTMTVIITCRYIREPDPRTMPLPEGESLSFIATFRYIIWSMKTMPSTVQKVCIVQFFAWMGWFPYLFYISSYVGDLCKCLSYIHWHRSR